LLHTVGNARPKNEKEGQTMDKQLSIGQILKAKGYAYSYIDPSRTAFDALEVLAEKNIGALLVMEAGKLVGMFSERDYARKVILKGRSSKTSPVRDLMSSPPITTGPDTSISECMRVMTRNHIRHLPVLEGESVMGVVSIGDVVNAIISEQENTIQDLESYISVGY
jgi:signal-transduction protein with cAMP-binding, CBS, and nucleotidyltransferase domain